MMSDGKANAANAEQTELRPMSEEAIARRLFGDLADDVLLLREHGHSVARFRGDYRVDREVLRYDELQARAKALRVRPPAVKKSRSPALAASAKPSDSTAVVPTGNEGRAGERDTARRSKSKAGPEPAGVATRPPADDAPQAERQAPPAKSKRGAGPRVPEITILEPLDLESRLARMEERIEFLFSVVAEAIQGRRRCMLDQASGLERLEATLRRSA